jgi:hypothetical protein
MTLEAFLFMIFIFAFLLGGFIFSLILVSKNK